MVMNKMIINIVGIFLLFLAAYVYINQQPPVSSTLYPNITSDNAKPDDSIKWTANARDPNTDPLVYKFSVSNSRGQLRGYSSWISYNTWIWNTSSQDIGLFLVKVEVRDRHHKGPDSNDTICLVDYIIKNKSPTADVTLRPESSQIAGGSVNIKASAWDRERNAITYEFQHKGPSSNDWETLKKYSSNEYTSSYEYTWSTDQEDIGQNYVRVIVSDYYNPSGSPSKEVSIEITDPKPEVMSLNPDLESPQPELSMITWTADAKDNYGDPILYKFFLSGPSTGGSLKEMTDWTSIKTWTWYTTGVDIGENQIVVWVRDGKHADPYSFDDKRSAYFTIEAPLPPTLYENMDVSV
jgi:hypothetical protein